MTGGSVTRILGALAVTSAAALAAYSFLVRPRHVRWGATPEEVARRLPGDEFVEGQAADSTRAITIRAPVEDVWPWLVQIGYGRGGFYSYDWLENLFMYVVRGTPGYRSVETILPKFQHLTPGEFIPAGPPDMLGGRLAGVAGWKVQAIEPYRALVLEGWTFVLERLDPRTTRLIVRTHDTGFSGRLMKRLFWEPAHFVMERRMLLGIKARAERLAGAAPGCEALGTPVAMKR